MANTEQIALEYKGVVFIYTEGRTTPEQVFNSFQAAMDWVDNKDTYTWSNDFD